MSDSLATYELRDGVGIITMDDGKANAISMAMQNDINAALDKAEADKVPVIFTGRPGFLSAGFDLKTIAAGGQPTVDMLNGGLELAIRLLSFPTPVIAACPGHAIAMGIFLLQSCDYRIGVNGKFRYTANEVAIGMAMPFSTIEILKQRLTPTAVSRAILLAEVFTPENAAQNGVIDVIVDETELMNTAMAFAQSTSGLNAMAHAVSKKRLREPVLEAIRAGLVKDDEAWRKQFLA